MIEFNDRRAAPMAYLLPHDSKGNVLYVNPSGAAGVEIRDTDHYANVLKTVKTAHRLDGEGDSMGVVKIHHWVDMRAGTPRFTVKGGGTLADAVKYER